MSDNPVLCVDHLTKPQNLQSVEESSAAGSSDEDSSIVVKPDACAIDVNDVEEHGYCDEEEPLIQMVECRICQDEDSVNNLESPCSCSGSLKFAHRKCVQRWVSEKGNIICEICHQTYQPGYFPPAPPPLTEVATIDISEWTVSGGPLGLHDQRILAVAAERRLLEPGYDEYTDSESSGTDFFRAASLTLMALLFLRHALYLTNGDADDDLSRFISLFLLRAAGFLLPCYIVAWAISILQRRRQRQEAAAIAAADVAVMIQAAQPRGVHYSLAPAAQPRGVHYSLAPAAQPRGVHYSLAPGPSGSPQQEPLQ